jgi:SAM-dependent methyltransferase
VGQTAFWVVAVVLTFTLLPWWFSRSFGLDAEEGCVLLFVLIGGITCVVLLVTSRNPMQFAAVLLAISVSVNWTEELAVGATSVRKLRNFYGIYKVYDVGNLRYLQHGTTQHGRQYTSGPKQGTPLAYFHPTTPAAGVLESDVFAFRNIGMIGLGTGALATYTGEGQTFTVYELDPDNRPIAEECFTYLELARANGATLAFVFGDGRVSLKKEMPGIFDVFMVDAFNSGSIPIHLMTVEAFEEYFRVLKQDGILLLHISNRMLDLAPVVYSNAQALGLYACEKTNAGNKDPDAENTVWMAVARERVTIEMVMSKLGWWQRGPAGTVKPWTDQYCNVMGAMFR